MFVRQPLAGVPDGEPLSAATIVWTGTVMVPMLRASPFFFFCFTKNGSKINIPAEPLLASATALPNLPISLLSRF